MLRLSQQLSANAVDFKGLHSSNSFSSQSHLKGLINSTGLSFFVLGYHRGGKSLSYLSICSASNIVQIIFLLWYENYISILFS